MPHPPPIVILREDEPEPPAACPECGRVSSGITCVRIVLIAMEAGTELKEHSAPGPTTIQAIRGRFTVTVDGSENSLAAETVIAIDESFRHTARAEEHGAFLLTIVWPGATNHRANEGG